MIIIKLALLVSLAAVVALIAFGKVYVRRLDTGRTHGARADQAAVTAYRHQLALAQVVISSLPAVRTWAEIGTDGRDEDTDAARDARIAAWEHSPNYFRARDLATMDEYTIPLGKICDRHRTGLLAVYEDGSLAAEGFGFPLQRDRARLAALYERAHDFDEFREMIDRPLTVTVDNTETGSWTKADQVELNRWIDANPLVLDEGAIA